jgi:hypothetical protein
MPGDGDGKFPSFGLPDVTKVDEKNITKFSAEAKAWRMIAPGLNLKGKCKKKTAQPKTSLFG